MALHDDRHPPGFLRAFGYLFIRQVFRLLIQNGYLEAIVSQPPRDHARPGRWFDGHQTVFQMLINVSAGTNQGNIRHAIPPNRYPAKTTVSACRGKQLREHLWGILFSYQADRKNTSLAEMSMPPAFWR